MESYIAQFDDFAINLFDITNSFSHALVRHEFINTDGAVIENMGRRPQELKFRTFWFGEKLEYTTLANPTYSNHFTFINEISDSVKSHTLVHPKYGTIIGYVENYTIIHDDTQEYAVIDISFVEKDLQEVGPVSNETISLALLQVDLLNAELAKSAAEMSSGGFGGILNTTVSFTASLNSQFNKVTLPVKNFLKECDTFLNQCDTLLKNITQPAVTVDSMVSFVSDVPSRLIGSMNQAANRIVGSLSHLSNLPAQFVNNMIIQSLAFKNIITGEHAAFFQTHFLTVCAGSIAVQTAIAMQTDDNNRKTAQKQEKKLAFDASGKRINQVNIPLILSASEIETMVYNCRNLIQTVIALDRDNQQLKDMAAQLITYVDNIKLKKQQQVSIDVNNIPLHLLCLQLGIPYNGSNRIYALNPGITNPTFTEGRIQSYVI